MNGDISFCLQCVNSDGNLVFLMEMKINTLIKIGEFNMSQYKIKVPILEKYGLMIDCRDAIKENIEKQNEEQKIEESTEENIRNNNENKVMKQKDETIFGVTKNWCNVKEECDFEFENILTKQQYNFDEKPWYMKAFIDSETTCFVDSLWWNVIIEFIGILWDLLYLCMFFCTIIAPWRFGNCIWQCMYEHPLSQNIKHLEKIEENIKYCVKLLDEFRDMILIPASNDFMKKRAAPANEAQDKELPPNLSDWIDEKWNKNNDEANPLSNTEIQKFVLSVKNIFKGIFYLFFFLSLFLCVFIALTLYAHSHKKTKLFRGLFSSVCVFVCVGERGGGGGVQMYGV